MTIKNLKETSVETIVECLNESFKNYFVPLPSEVDYWKNRFKSGRIAMELSYGMFIEGKLVGFILNGIDRVDDELIAFNAGTAVTAESRGQQITDQLYAYAIPNLKENGVTKCRLEVIQQNEIAIHVYEKIGFKTTRQLKCFKGSFEANGSAWQVKEVPYTALVSEAEGFDNCYSWENMTKAMTLANGTYKSYQVLNEKNKQTGFFVINPFNTYISQLEITTGKPEDWPKLFAAIASVAPMVKVINVDEHRRDMIEALKSSGLENHIDQYEMELPLP